MTPKNEFSTLMLFPGIKGVLRTGLSEELASQWLKHLSCGGPQVNSYETRDDSGFSKNYLGTLTDSLNHHINYILGRPKYKSDVCTSYKTYNKCLFIDFVGERNIQKQAYSESLCLLLSRNLYLAPQRPWTEHGVCPHPPSTATTELIRISKAWHMFSQKPG